MSTSNLLPLLHLKPLSPPTNQASSSDENFARQLLLERGGDAVAAIDEESDRLELFREMKDRVAAHPGSANAQLLYHAEELEAARAGLGPIVIDDSVNAVEIEWNAHLIESALDLIRTDLSWLTGDSIMLLHEYLATQQWFKMQNSVGLTDPLWFKGKIADRSITRQEREATAKHYMERQILSQARIISISNFDNLHWAVLELEPSCSTIRVFDSGGDMAKSREKSWRQALMEFCHIRWPQSQRVWSVEYPPCPQQQDGSACGIYSICTGLMRLKGLDPMDSKGPHSIRGSQAVILAKIRHLRVAIANDLAQEVPTLSWMGAKWRDTVI